MKRHRETNGHKVAYKKAKRLAQSTTRVRSDPPPPPSPPPPPPTDPTHLPTQDYDSAGSWMRPFIEPELMLPPTPPPTQSIRDDAYVSIFAPSFSASDNILLEVDPNLDDEPNYDTEGLEHEFVSAINDDTTRGGEGKCVTGTGIRV